MVWYLEDRNIAIFGGTRQGKSVGANQIFTTDGRIGVFFAPDPESWFSGVVVHSPKAIIEGMKEGYRKFQYALDWQDSDIEGHHDRLVYNLMKWGENYGLKSTLVTDEAQEVGDWLVRGCKRGLKRGLRNLVLTQDPATVPNTALRQCDYYVYVGPASPFDIEYLMNKGIDARAFQANNNHQYRVIDRQGTEIDSGYFDNQRFGPGN